MLKIDNISKSINDTKILKNISLELNDGEILGLLGPNGAGKTTLMRIITGYYNKNAGEVILDDKIINYQNIEFLKKQIGYLPENNPLYEDMTVEEYLKFCLSIHDIKKEEHDIKIKEVIESCSIKDRLKDDIKTLSKGLKQRVGLAGALIHNPKILILDEPTTGLDPNQILEIRELIKKISKNKTIMISTHIMQEVEAICDRVIIINKGEIVLSSDINEIKSKTESNILKAKIKTEENISDRVKNEISTINNVLEVNTNFSSGEINIEIKVDSNIDLRHDFMKYIQIHNYDLLEIIKKESTLEDIFKKLTK
ncbi:ATP-binding cassette domain-containing protein [Patescibacteria group bacterium]|nr:ATP-binding cassette domain-containing protein [Patescibacteria group bacterium]